MYVLEESVQGRRTKSGCWVDGVLFSMSDWQPVNCVGNFVIFLQGTFMFPFSEAGP